MFTLQGTGLGSLQMLTRFALTRTLETGALSNSICNTETQKLVTFTAPAGSRKTKNNSKQPDLKSQVLSHQP